MWQDMLIIISMSLAVYSLYNFTLIIVKKIISSTKVSKKIYSFKGEVIYYPLVGIIIFIINLSGLGQRSVEELSVGKYMLSIIIPKLYNEYGVLNKHIVFVFSIFLIINFIVSMYVKPVMYEEGIICENGNFLSWDNIKSITTLKNLVGNKKYIVINTDNKEVYLRVTTDEGNEVKEIIFNKTGIVSKEIVTEFS